MRIYIAGPITGKYDYRKKFNAAEQELHKMGHIVINPSHLPAGLKDYMPICFAMIDQCEAVYFLANWKDSVGASEEWEYAIDHGKELFFERYIDERRTR